MMVEEEENEVSSGDNGFYVPKNYTRNNQLKCTQIGRNIMYSTTTQYTLHTDKYKNNQY